MAKTDTSKLTHGARKLRYGWPMGSYMGCDGREEVFVHPLKPVRVVIVSLRYADERDVRGCRRQGSHCSPGGRRNGVYPC